MMYKSKEKITELFGKPITTANGNQYCLIAWTVERRDYVFSYVPVDTVENDSWTEDQLILVYVDRNEVNQQDGFNTCLYDAAILAETYVETDPQAERRVA